MLREPIIISRSASPDSTVRTVTNPLRRFKMPAPTMVVLSLEEISIAGMSSYETCSWLCYGNFCKRRKGDADEAGVL